MTGLSFRNLRFSYNKPVLIDCSLDAKPSEVTVIAGPSGCGKTTLLKVLAGALEPQAGTLTLGGTSLLGVPIQRRGVAFIMDDWGLYPHRTVAGNLAFPLEVRKLSRGSIDERVKSVALRVGLGELLGRRPHELSAGQRQRVAIARVLVRGDDVRLLLADEPWSNLDQTLRHALRAEFRRFCRSLNIPAILVSHDQRDADIADVLVVMREGAFVQAGSPLDLYQRPTDRFVAEFIAYSPPNILPTPDQTWVTLFRPEHAELRPLGEASLNGKVVDVQMSIPQPIAILETSEGIVVRVPCRAPALPGVGERLSVAIAADNLLRFDKSTGKRLL